MRSNGVSRRINARPRFSTWRSLLPWLLAVLLAILFSVWAGTPDTPVRIPPPPQPSSPVVVRQEPPPPEPEEAGCPEGCREPPPGCDIKGNIRRERIYHLPGQLWYDETVIDPGQGERWFCTEEEAIANGWRRAKV
jgi:hypothetical protein